MIAKKTLLLSIALLVSFTLAACEGTPDFKEAQQLD